MCNFLSFCYNASPSKDKFGRFAQLFTFLKSQSPPSPPALLPVSCPMIFLYATHKKRPFPNCSTSRTLLFNLSLNRFISVSLAEWFSFWLLFCDNASLTDVEWWELGGIVKKIIILNYISVFLADDIWSMSIFMDVFCNGLKSFCEQRSHHFENHLLPS